MLSPAAATGRGTGAAQGRGEDTTVVFYQSQDGQLIFLEPELTKQLLQTHGTWGNLPHGLTLRLKRVRSEPVSDELQRRHRFLGHLQGGEVSFASGTLEDPSSSASGGGAPAHSEG